MRIARVGLVLGALFFFGQCSAAAAGRGLKFSICLDKSEYKKSDPIYITFTLKNKGRRPVYINKRFFVNSGESPRKKREVYIIVTSPSGEKLKFKRTRDTGFPKTDYFVPLKRGEEATSEKKRNLRAYFALKDPGTYEITAVYQNVYGMEIGIDAFRSKIKSAPVKIKITE